MHTLRRNLCFLQLGCRAEKIFLADAANDCGVPYPLPTIFIRYNLPNATKRHCLRSRGSISHGLVLWFLGAFPAFLPPYFYVFLGSELDVLNGYKVLFHLRSFGYSLLEVSLLTKCVIQLALGSASLSLPFNNLALYSP